MLHLGDITKISGYTAPVVDCIIGGSPCQDLSVAGKRAGLDGERSGLYMEQIRIVKEMRAQDERNGRAGVDIRPRYMVWENVPGAFSSNKGEDFRIVLEEIARVKDPELTIPRPDDGKWRTSGCIVGDGWSVAWRVLDAQFWGTSDKPLPQRRRRIALVADFGGQSASEILFVREGVSGDTQPGEPKRKETPSDASRGVGADDRGGRCFGISSYDSNAMKSGNPNSGIYEAETARTLDGNGGNPSCNQGGIAVVENVPYTLKIRGGVAVDSMGKAAGKGALIQEDLSATLGVSQDQYLFQPVVFKADDGRSGDVVPTLVGDHNNRVTDHTALVVALDRATFNQGKNAKFDFEVSTKGVSTPLVAKGPSAVCYGVNGDKAGTLDASYYKGCGMRSGVEREIVAIPAKTRYIVRRLTPLECERLQGYPDGWTDIGEYIDSNGKKRQTSDAARYKALGNSIALPPWKWVLKRLCACYERDATMASLFDGIGGFPYLWEQLNGKGSCLWASEIE